jgi:hypothetical protein
MVYDADGTITGEVSYWIGHHIFGKVSCSLCDISHGTFRQKQVWKQWVDGLAQRGVVVQTLHRNDLSRPEHHTTREVIDNRFPCVVVHDDDGSVKFIAGDAELIACNGQVDALALLLAPTLNRNLGE